MRNLLVAIALSFVTVFATCEDNDFKNDLPCSKISYGYPLYSNGDKYEVGKWVCFGKDEQTRTYKDTTIQGIPVSLYGWYKPCKEIVDITPQKSFKFETKTVYEYLVDFGRETVFEPILEKGSFYTVRVTSDVFYEASVIELYREDGTLRYKGRVLLSDSSVSTSGDCYNKKGKVTRHTNNADLCQ